MVNSPMTHAPLASAILVKPVSAQCNMRCGYCFYSPAKRGMPEPAGRMAPPVLKTLISQAARLPSRLISFCWQGGEPLIAGLNFYKEALKLQKKIFKDKYFNNSIQTNGLMLDDDWIGLLKNENFLVGLSIDGPPEFHDKFRKTAKGNPTGGKILDSAHRLVDADVPVNAICCVTSKNVYHLNEIYSFFKNEGFSHAQFIPIHETDNDGNLLEASVGSDDYGYMLCALWDVWLKDLEEGRAIGIRFFESYCHKAFGLPPTLCEMDPVCGSYAVVEADGSIFPCDFFVRPAWRTGNIGDGLPEALVTPKAHHFNEIRLLLYPQCRECEYRIFCNGGCLKYRKTGPRIHPRHVFCEAYKKFFSHAEKGLGKAHAIISGSSGFWKKAGGQ